MFFSNKKTRHLNSVNQGGRLAVNVSEFRAPSLIIRAYLATGRLIKASSEVESVATAIKIKHHGITFLSAISRFYNNNNKAGSKADLKRKLKCLRKYSCNDRAKLFDYKNSRSPGRGVWIIQSANYRPDKIPRALYWLMDWSAACVLLSSKITRL